MSASHTHYKEHEIITGQTSEQVTHKIIDLFTVNDDELQSYVEHVRAHMYSYLVYTLDDQIIKIKKASIQGLNNPVAQANIFGEILDQLKQSFIIAEKKIKDQKQFAKTEIQKKHIKNKIKALDHLNNYLKSQYIQKINELQNKELIYLYNYSSININPIIDTWTNAIKQVLGDIIVKNKIEIYEDNSPDIVFTVAVDENQIHEQFEIESKIIDIVRSVDDRFVGMACVMFKLK